MKKDQRQYVGTREDRKLNPVRVIVLLALLSWAAIASVNWNRNVSALDTALASNVQLERTLKDERAAHAKFQRDYGNMASENSALRRANGTLATQLADANRRLGRAETSAANNRIALRNEKLRREGVNQAFASAVQKPTATRVSKSYPPAQKKR